MELNRRSFLKGMALTGGMALTMSMAACASDTEVTEPAADESAIDEAAINPAEVKDCDIAVVGVGLSGLAACVEAAESGLTVIGIESNSTVGGGAAVGVEGTFGYGSSMFKDAGIQVDPHDILVEELVSAQHRNNALLWKDLFEDAGPNIDWLVSQGVEFNGEIDDYHGGKFDVFHWYKNGHASEGYVPPMEARINELGVEILLETTAKKLISENGKVTGVYAEKTDGEWIQVNAKAVILASGGIGSNAELVSRIGYDVDRLGCMFPYAQGYGYKMAMELGAMDAIPGCADQNAPMIGALPKGQMNMLFCQDPTIPWINQDCERFYAEDIVVANMSYSNPPKWNQKDYFMIFDQQRIDEYGSWGTDSVEDFGTLVDEAVAANDGAIYRADSIRELATFYDLDADALEATWNDYNRMCKAGRDEFFGKSAEYMKAMETGPFYIARPMWVVFCVVGSIGTNRNMQVVDSHLDPIGGLYATGNDGCMLYRNIYTIDTPGTCSGFGIASGRKAVQHAKATYCS